jgi:putative SOS response-associated peptidase YedK
MPSWKRGQRVLVAVSWFYEFDSRVKPQVPYAVFPLQAPFWSLAGLAQAARLANGQKTLTVSIITVEPNEVLKSVGHHRSPAILRNPAEAENWLSGTEESALSLLRPYPNERMGVEVVPMGIKIPGNQAVEMPGCLSREDENQ